MNTLSLYTQSDAIADAVARLLARRAFIREHMPRLREFIDQGRIYTCYPDTGEALAHVETIYRADLPALAPETSTEAAQQNAAELEQADEPCHLHARVISNGITLDSDKLVVVIPAGTVGCLLGEPMFNYSDGAPCSRPYHVQFYVGRASYDFCATPEQLTFPQESQPDMFAARVDDLPLFSGTAPRVADPGRFDPPAAQPQPRLF